MSAVISYKSSCDDAYDESPGVDMPFRQESTILFRLSGNCVTALHTIVNNHKPVVNFVIREERVVEKKGIVKNKKNIKKTLLSRRRDNGPLRFNQTLFLVGALSCLLLSTIAAARSTPLNSGSRRLLAVTLRLHSLQRHR
ncbi:hypothetical protein ACSQ67_015344 [Phaseolus vulgaris]